MQTPIEQFEAHVNAGTPAAVVIRPAPKYPLCHTVDYGKAGQGKIGRATYRPDWSKSAPWVSYVGGTAGRHFETLEQATAYFRERHNAYPVGGTVAGA
ncbi:hypothetical protein D3C87_559140 [compost metagenome]